MESFPDLNEFPTEPELEALKKLQIGYYPLSDDELTEEDKPYITLLETGRAASFSHFGLKLLTHVFLPEMSAIKIVAVRIELTSKRDPILVFRRIYANWILRQRVLSEEKYVSVLKHLILNKEYVIFSIPDFLYGLFQSDLDNVTRMGGKLVVKDLSPKEKSYRCTICGHPVRNIQRLHFLCPICNGKMG